MLFRSIKSKIKKGGKKKIDMSHDRKKKYVLEEGVPVPFLQDLGVMTQDGKIVHAKFDKFRQINRFLEFIEDILPELDKGRELTILDFGCGKSYLTFAMYYYLHELKEYDIRIIGLDLKKDVDFLTGFFPSRSDSSRVASSLALLSKSSLFCASSSFMLASAFSVFT